MRIIIAVLLCCLIPAWVCANDSAVETAAGGLQLRNEKRVSIAKERLYIGKQFIGREPSNLPHLQYKYRVNVEYEFMNGSSKDVTTEVAFPLPQFSYPSDDLIQDRKVSGFKVEVDGKEQPFETVVRAIAKGRDVTDLLKGYGIEIESFGNFSEESLGAGQYQKDLLKKYGIEKKSSGDSNENSSETGKYQVERLPKEAQARLKAAGALDAALAPNWSVSITYHWKQTFPAGKVVRVRHEYDAIPGFSLDSDLSRYLSTLEKGCFNTELKRGLQAAQKAAPASNSGGEVLVQSEWVKYILTTAKTWKMPIRDFELVVEAPEGDFVSFCWNGKTEKLSNNRFRATAKDFVPNRELLIYFFSIMPNAEL
ncbi:MAG: DUF4424 family protein [Syntrophobacteraceae bacterium]